MTTIKLNVSLVLIRLFCDMNGAIVIFSCLFNYFGLVYLGMIIGGLFGAWVAIAGSLHDKDIIWDRNIDGMSQSKATGPLMQAGSTPSGSTI